MECCTTLEETYPVRVRISILLSLSKTRSGEVGWDGMVRCPCQKLDPEKFGSMGGSVARVVDDAKRLSVSKTPSGEAGEDGVSRGEGVRGKDT
jgi:hypothetical protein